MPRTKKDPKKPKGRKGAYIFFLEAERKKLEGHVDFQAFSSDMSKKWKALADEEKVPFQKLAEEDRMRYQKEMENYSPPPSDDEGSTRKKKRKREKDPNAPKRHMSAYIHFSNNQRPKVKESNPSKTIGQISKLIAELWNKMNEEDKEPFVKMAEEDKTRYLKEMETYHKDGNAKRAKAEE